MRWSNSTRLDAARQCFYRRLFPTLMRFLCCLFWTFAHVFLGPCPSPPCLIEAMVLFLSHRSIAYMRVVLSWRLLCTLHLRTFQCQNRGHNSYIFNFYSATCHSVCLVSEIVFLCNIKERYKRQGTSKALYRRRWRTQGNDSATERGKKNVHNNIQ